MNEKKNTAKFTIQFNPSIAAHLKAIKILNSVPPRSKAQLITDALLLYNQTLGLADVTTTEDVVINVPEVKKTASKKIFDDEQVNEPVDETVILDEYDYDEDEPETENDEFNDIFAQSLMSMGFSKKSESED
jgi:hypothetical protein